MFVISHGMLTNNNTDKIFVMDSGTITARGTFVKLRRDVPLIREHGN